MSRLSPENRPRGRAPIDWRGWLALAWALGWFQAYVVMVVHARSARFLELLHAVWK